MNSNPLTPSLLIENVSRRGGLPSHQIHSLCYSHRKIWLSTPNGLAVYDGEHVVILNQHNGLLTHGQRSVTSNEETILACSDLGVSVINSDSLQVIASLNTVELGLGWCQCAISTGKDNYLLGCGKGLYQWHSKSGKLSVVNLDILGEGVLSMVKGKQATILVQMSQSGIWVYQNKIIRPLINHNTHILQSVSHISSSPQGFFIANNKSIIHLDFDLKLKEHIELQNKSSIIVCILVRNSNHMIIADKYCVYELIKHHDNWQKGKTFCTTAQINDICYDSFNNLWIGTDFSGLIKYSALNDYIKTFRPEKSTSVLTLRRAHNGQDLLIGGTGHSYLLSPINKSIQNEIISLKGLSCWDIYQDKQLTFFAACNEGLAITQLENNSLAQLFTDKRVGAGRCIQKIGKNYLYGSVYGLFIFHLDQKKFQPINDILGNTLSYIYTIVPKEGNKYFITTLGRGLWVYNGEDNKIIPVELGSQHLNVYDISQNKQGVCVIAADNKILLMTESKVTEVFKSTDSVAAWTCRWHSNDKILIGTSQGLQLFDINTRQVNFIVNNIPEQQFWEFTTSRSLLKLDKDIYWCGLNERLVVIDIPKLIDAVQAPLPEIKSVSSSSHFLLDSNVITIEEGNWNLDITLCSFWLWKEKSINYHYRLVGLHNNWRRTKREPLMYSSLPTGEYLLEVQVKCGLTQANQKYQLIIIKVINKGFIFKLSTWLKKLIATNIIKMTQRKNFWKLNESNIELEKLVNNRTTELSVANQKLQEMNLSLEILSNKDQLTGINNRRAFLNLADDELKRASRYQSQFSILMIDIDYFKQYNDNYGHLAGDLCLEKVAQNLLSCLHRSGDILARYGGKEFIIALPEVDQKQAAIFANICINSINNLGISHQDSAVGSNVTISIGVASTLVETINNRSDRISFLTNLIRQADTNLYLAKEQGRNRSVS
ncbi:diguanylate cyclase domain-containing protein [Colwellia hornerae]|uniref:diguanylate cyclase n=1 Tax=Colwellia hornerae TaxID=89402 RepID=A0A5C6QMW2_9GAMM|nr:diguanylate cyclase [Colwellia hornerae]TWX53642.1 diguanylate cyclase [Colwellia hornerae]TWX60293.1 diguanylate cyclase [Colwellia hornerae]TWX70048.1 diguanylate cyclase [Colwellia hornerae]